MQEGLQARPGFPAPVARHRVGMVGMKEGESEGLAGGHGGPPARENHPQRSRMRSSTRRFSARPAAVALSAMGRDSP